MRVLIPASCLNQRMDRFQLVELPDGSYNVIDLS
jgi:hypothetical protein